MSRIDDLIAELCPNGVPFCALGDIAQTVSGLSGKSKADFTNGNARFITYKNVFGNLAVDQSAPDFVRVGANEKQNLLLLGDVVFTGSSESLDEVGMSSVVVHEPTEPLYLNSFCFIVRIRDPSLLDRDFSKYLFRSELVRKQIRTTASGVTRINISKERFMKIRFPAPPLEVQREIVRILDQFTRLEAELEAEIDRRFEQRSVISTNFSVRLRDARAPITQRVTLGDIAHESIVPVKVQRDQRYVSLGVKWNGAGVLVREPRYGKDIKAKMLYSVKPAQLIYNRMFVVEGSFALVPNECESAVVSSEFPIFDIDTSMVDPYWLLNYLCSGYTLGRIEKEVTGTERGTMKSRRRWKSSQFTEFEVSLPPLEVQREITGFLTTSDLYIQALRDERAARRKQYEYYRDKLLTFPEAA